MLSLIDWLIFFLKNQLEKGRLTRNKFKIINLNGIKSNNAINIFTQKSPIDKVIQGTPVL